MANVTKHISDFRLLAGGVDTAQLTDANALVLLNKIYRENINLIKVKVKEYYFYNYWLTNTIVGQSEYTLPVRDDANGVAGCTKIIGVSIKNNDTDLDFFKLRPENQANLDRDVLSYDDSQSESNGIFLVKDNSYFIKPAPKNVIVGGIRVYGIADPVDLVLGSTEPDVLIPLEYQDIISLGMVYLYYKSRLLTNEKNDALNEYKMAQSVMITGLSDRIEVPLVSEEPNLTHLK